MWLLNILKLIIGVCALVLIFPFFLVLRLFNKPVDLSNEEVEDVLVKMSLNEPDDYLCDDFLSIPIKNKELENIREQLDIIWAHEEFQEKNKEGIFVLNELGLYKVDKLIIELRNLKNT